MTFRGPKGGVATLNVPREAQNLDQVKAGQRYRLKYVEAVAVEIVRTQHLAGEVDAVDYTNRYIAVRGPKGNVVSLKAADDVPLGQLSAGGPRNASTLLQRARDGLHCAAILRACRPTKARAARPRTTMKESCQGGAP